MRLRWLWVASALCIGASLSLSGQSDNPLFPLNEVRPGLKGVGRTIFEGDTIEEFQVEILGVLRNALAPKHDTILAKLSGSGIERTGVIAGMSGSPVYVDGKLLGAVATAFPFSKEPYTLITPIRDMLEVVPEPAQPNSEAGAETPAASASLPWRIGRVAGEAKDLERLLPGDETGPESWSRLLRVVKAEGTLGDVRLPLRFGGFAADAIQAYTPLFREFGFEPLGGGALSGGTLSPGNGRQAASVHLTPGSMISLLFVRGDLNLNADCTVTYVRDNSLYACGHQIFLAGPVQIPFAKASVLAVIPSLASSFKIDAPGPLMGSIHQDRFGAIYGVLGDSSPAIPVHVQVSSSLNRKTDYNFDVVEQPLLAPLLVNLAVISTLSATERMVGPSTLQLKGKIRLSSGDSIALEDVLSSEASAANAAGAAVAMPLSFLLASDFPGLRVEGIDVTVASQNQNRVAHLEQVWSTKSEVQPGDHIEVTAVLRTPSGESLTQKIPVDIPPSISDKMLSLVVGGGPAINILQNRFTAFGSPPRDLRQMVRVLNRTRRNNRLYALLMAPQRSFILQGDEYPSPPPSLLQTFLASPGVSSSVIFSGTSVVGDYETKPTPYAIEGQQNLFLKVVSAER